MTEPEERPEGVESSDVLDDVPLSAEESLDSDDLGDTDAGRDPLDDSWTAPDQPSPETRARPAAAQRQAGSPLDEQLAQELPDVNPYEDAEKTSSRWQ